MRRLTWAVLAGGTLAWLWSCTYSFDDSEVRAKPDSDASAGGSSTGGSVAGGAGGGGAAGGGSGGTSATGGAGGAGGVAGAGGGAGGSGGVTGGTGGATGGTGGATGGSGGATGGSGGVTGGSGGATGGTGGATGGTGGTTAIDQAVAYFGDFDVDSTHQIAFAKWPGPLKTVPAPTGIGTGDMNDIAYSKDGTKLAIVGQIGGQTVLNVYAADASGTPQQLYVANPSTKALRKLTFSPDGKMIAFVADFDLLDSYGAYVISLSGGAPRRLTPVPTSTAQDVVDLAWSPDSKYLAYVHDFAVNETFVLDTIDVTNPASTPVAIVAQAELTVDEDVWGGIAFGPDGWLYFVSDWELTNIERLYKAQANGTGRVNVPTGLVSNTPNPEVGAFAFSPDGTKLAVSAESPSDGTFEVWVLPFGTIGTASNRSSFNQVSAFNVGPALGMPIWWSADGQWLAVTADYPVTAGSLNDAFCAFVMPAAGTPAMKRLWNNSLDAALGVEKLGFSKDSKRLFALGDITAAGVSTLLSTADFGTQDQSISASELDPLPTGGDIDGFAVRP